MTLHTFAALAVLLSTTPAAPAVAAVETIQLKAGEVHLLKVKGLTRMAINDPKIVEVNGEGARQGLKALTSGEAIVVLWTRDGRRRTLRVVVR